MAALRASLIALAVCASLPALAQPHAVDLRGLPTAPDALVRVHGHTGTGELGLPVAGGLDADGDGHADFAFSSMRASPEVGGTARPGAGEVYLVFGDGTGGGTYDTGAPSPDILELAGLVDNEAAGSELWMDDVTGDGLGDLLIARQNFTPASGRIGAGALTILVGGPELAERAARPGAVNLSDPLSGLQRMTFVGAAALDRLGIWMRTGDVTGDGVADIVVGADQAGGPGETHRGAVYVIQGGPHLAQTRTIDLADFGATAFAGRIARITPPPGSAHHHFGATCQIADLDGNGRAEVLVATALNRAGAGIRAAGSPPRSAHARGGSPDGTLYVAWDDNFPDVWPAGFAFEVTSGPGAHTAIHGAPCNVSFGEEILGGLDYDDDGRPDLFVGDIVGNCAPSQSRINAGAGHVFFDAGRLAGRVFDLSARPADLTITDFYGGAQGDIAADTALHGDFDGDGIADLAFSSPHAARRGRLNAGAIHVFFGQRGGWPAEIDLRTGFVPGGFRFAEVWGARGNTLGDVGDTLSYSAAAGDVNGDGRVDLITNEMVGNGLQPGTVDVGNLIVVSGSLVAPAGSARGRGLAPPAVPALPVWAGLLLATALSFGWRGRPG